MVNPFSIAARRRTSRSRRRSVRPAAFELLESRLVLSADIFVATNGNDSTGNGTVSLPFATLAKAVEAATAGDTVVLRGGTYAGGVRIKDPNITIRSQDGEWAVIKSPTNIEDIDTVISFDIDASGGRLQRLELIGGYYYAVKTETTFDWGPPTPQYGASRIVIEDCRIHDTGRDCIKITPNCDDISILRCEIYNSGRRDPGNAEGIDNVNGDRMVVQDCFIHDIATNGLYAKGGSNGSIIERNLIKDIGEGGIMVGFYTDAEYFDTTVNPNYYENINCVVRNNIVVNAEAAGIGLYAALNPRIVGNTLVNVARSSQAALLINTTQIYFGENPDPLRVPCRDVLIVNNVVTQSAGSSRPMFQIRLDQEGAVPMDGLAGTLTIGANRFFRENGTAEFVDDRVGRDYDGGLAGWSTLIGSVAGSEGSPGLDANLHLAPGSPCIDAGVAIADLTDDYDGNARPVSPDIGADEADAGAALQVPPAAGTIGTHGSEVHTPSTPGGNVGPTPRPPTAVLGTPGNGQVSLRWTAAASSTGPALVDYVVQYSADSGVTWTTFDDGLSTAASATVTGLTNGTAYVFRVAGVNSSGTGGFSTASAGVTPRSVPGVPSAVVGTAGNGQVALVWTAPDTNGGAAITDYVVQYSTTGGTTWTTYNDGTSTAVSATIKGLTNGRAYVFRVAAKNSVGTGGVSAVSAAVTPKTVPGMPTGLTATPSDGQVSLKWTAPAATGGVSIADYSVQYSVNNGSTWTTFDDGVSPASSATVTGLANGTACVFRVAAVNAAGTGVFTAKTAAVTPRTVPGAPTALSGTAGNGQVILKWLAPAVTGGAAITDYSVQYSVDNGSTWTTYNDGTSTATSATVKGLVNGTAYMFRVAAKNLAGVGGYVATSSAVTPRTVPGVPAAVVGTAGNGQVSLSWSAPGTTGGASITDYVVQYSLTNGSTWTTFNDGVSSGTAATVTGLVNGTSYVFRVAAVNAAGTGGYSAKTAAIRPRA